MEEKRKTICVRVDCRCPFPPDWPYYPKDIIGIHRIGRDDPRAKIGSHWAVKEEYCHGDWYSQGCEEETCIINGEVVEIIEECETCSYKNNCPGGGYKMEEIVVNKAGKIVLTRKEFMAHFIETDWMKEFVENNLKNNLGQIVERYDYCNDDQNDEQESSTYHYPQKGVLLNSGGIPEKSRYYYRYSYLLETGEFAEVKEGGYRDTVRTSFYHWADVEHKWTEMTIWTNEEVEKNKEKITEWLLRLLEKSQKNGAG